MLEILQGRWDSSTSHQTMRELTAEELNYVSGGDGGGGSCSAGDCGASASDGSDAAGTLAEVTVTSSQNDGIGDQQAQQLMTQIEFAFTDPLAALLGFFSLIGNASIPSMNYPTIPVNPMGDPSPGGP
ncbi:hypothetical protein GCM10023165_09260 [Variovorax defluvii]|uniref:Uncharacterized protein n=1 Tax=Variovorax defluvii TaxID=913761 RepID=A0ABP8H467_9BURK